MTKVFIFSDLNNLDSFFEKKVMSKASCRLYNLRARFVVCWSVRFLFVFSSKNSVTNT